MDQNFASAAKFDNWVNASATERQASRPDQSAGVPGHDAAAGKLRLAANLQAAKEAGPQKGPGRDASAPETAQQEQLSGKPLLSANLKAAKESSKETDQSHDTSRSR